MAKKKETKKVEKAVITPADIAISNIQSAMDDFMVDKQKFARVHTEEKLKIPTGIKPLDLILGGGIAIGGLTLIVGRPGGGKSALACKLISSGQHEYPGNFLGMYADKEQAMSMKRLYQLGVTNPPLKPYSEFTLEVFFKYIDGMKMYKQVHNLVDTPSIIVLDSLANTKTEKELEATAQKDVIGYKASVLALMLPKYIDIANKYNIAIVIIQQLRDNIQMGVTPQAAQMRYMSQKEVIPGGNALRYNAFHILKLRDTKVVDEDFFRGHEVSAKCIKNKFCAPNVETNLMFSFNEGYSDEWSMFNALKEAKMISGGAGGWYQLQDFSEIGNFRRQQFMERYTTDDKFKDAFLAQYDIYEQQINDKYFGDIPILTTVEHDDIVEEVVSDIPVENVNVPTIAVRKKTTKSKMEKDSDIEQHEDDL